MFSFINESLALEQTMITVAVTALYLLFRGRALWNLDYKAIASKKGFVIDFVLNFIGGAYWMYCFFVDWKTSAFMAITLSLISCVISYMILRARMNHLLNTRQ